MQYDKYIESKEWKEKRQQRLEIDGHQCVVCKCSEGLSVHHLHYQTLGNEDPRNDLISVCAKHHRFFDDIERMQRYEKRKRLVKPISDSVQLREDFKHGMENSILPIDIYLSDDRSQRTMRQPIRPVHQATETGVIETRENRR